MKFTCAKVVLPCVLLAIHLSANASPDLEPVVGLPCEGCEFLFVGMSIALPVHSRIAPVGTPGEPLHLQGRALNVNGAPVPGVVVYAYHAYRKGGAPRRSKLSAFHGDLRGWAKTDAAGRYSFDTIRADQPANGLQSGNIFMHVLEPGRCTYSINAVVFADAAKATAEAKSERGGTGIAMPVKDTAGVWQVTRDIHLGRNISGYERCNTTSAPTK